MDKCQMTTKSTLFTATHVILKGDSQVLGLLSKAAGLLYPQ